MASSRETGGPAFPVPQNTAAPQLSAYGLAGNPGMSLRDWFAGLAMQALIASNDEGAGDRIEDVPRYAYQIAEAMIRQVGR